MLSTLRKPLLGFLFFFFIFQATEAKASIGRFCLLHLQSAYQNTLGKWWGPPLLPMDEYRKRVSKLQGDPSLLQDPRKIYKSLRKFLMNKAKLSEDVASKHADSDVKSLLLEAKKNKKEYADWDPVALSIISDWDTSRMMSRAMDYVTLRNDMDAKSKAILIFNVIQSIPVSEQFRANYETVEVRKTDPSRYGHFFQGDAEELYIDPDGVLYKNIPGQQIKFNSEGEVDLKSVRKREPKRSSLVKLFQS